MRGAGRTADRFRDLVRHRVVPGLAELGFDARLPGTLAATEALGVAWLLDVDLAPWSSPERVCFTVTWGVHVPGIEEVVGDPVPQRPSVATCPVQGRLGERVGIEPSWFELRARPMFLGRAADTALARQVLSQVALEILPRLRRLSTPVEVQRFLHAGLVTGRGAPSSQELQRIRHIAALSLLLGDRHNAARWLDHLEARSATTMAPDLVAERLAPLRQQCLAS